MDILRSLVGGSGGNGVIDGMKLVVLGGTVETARRVASSGWSSFVNSFFLTAHFSEEEYPYDWIKLWLSRRPEWQRSREFETTTRTSTPGFGKKACADNSFGDEDEEEDEDDLVPGKVKTRVVFNPTFDTTLTIYYRGHWLRVKRWYKQTDGTEVLSISVVARNNTVLKQLVLEAKKAFEAESVHMIQIYFAETHGGWRWTDSRHKRPLSSIVLNPGVKEMLLADTRDFLRSEKWYADRGIPFRRGYLLHGQPGSGKSSLIHALAGELQLDVYVVSLSASWISDTTLQALMGRVPARCILLFEDLDAAFTRSTTRDDSSTGIPEGGNNSSSSKDDDRIGDLLNGMSGGFGSGSGLGNRGSSSRRKAEHLSEVNTLTLSGLLNSLDGVSAAEGRILFATTNHLERLDPALSRPGRMDVWLEFRDASKWQAEALFRNFFPAIEEDDDVISEADLASVDAALDGKITLPQGGTYEQGDIILDGSKLDAFNDDGFIPPAEASGSHSRSNSTGSWSRTPSYASSVSSLSSPITASSSGSKLMVDTSSPSKAGKREDMFGAKNRAYLPPPVESHIATAQHSAKPLDSATLGRLAKKFADAIPEEEFSVASLQGYLLKNKSTPEKAADEAYTWVVDEREMRERLKREKEARELKEKMEREKRRKEYLEKERDRADVEKKELELARIKAQLEEREKAQADKQKLVDDKTALETAIAEAAAKLAAHEAKEKLAAESPAKVDDVESPVAVEAQSPASSPATGDDK